MSKDASELALHRVDLVMLVPRDDIAVVEQSVHSDLDARQDEALRMLDELNARIEAVIQQATASLPPVIDQPAVRPTAA
jgi:hypothetical protein